MSIQIVHDSIRELEAVNFEPGCFAQLAAALAGHQAENYPPIPADLICTADDRAFFPSVTDHSTQDHGLCPLSLGLYQPGLGPPITQSAFSHPHFGQVVLKLLPCVSHW
ncbi:hypothetical protein D3C79_634900 [compost metagenome]